MNSSDSVDFKACMEQATHFAAQLRIVHILYLVLLAFVADYVWMLSMRWRMVRSFPSHCRLTYVALTKSQPPGPFPWPICGNTFSLPNEKPWYYFEQLSKDYNSPLITFWLGRFVTSTRPSALRSLNRYRRPTIRAPACSCLRSWEWARLICFTSTRTRKNSGNAFAI
jgi:hypothetical protein